MFFAKVGDPIPAKDAFDPDNDVIEKRKDQLEEQLRIGFNVLVNFSFSFLVDNAYIHLACMQIDTAIVLVLLIVKSHSCASFLQLDDGLGVNRFYTEDVSEATSRRIFRARMGLETLLVGAREILLLVTG